MRCGKLSNIREIYHVVPILTIESQANSRLSKAQMIWPLVNVQLIFTSTNSSAVNPPERVALSKFETVQAKLDAAIDTCEITLVCQMDHRLAWTCLSTQDLPGLAAHTCRCFCLCESIHLPEISKAVPGGIARFENSPFCHLSPG